MIQGSLQELVVVYSIVAVEVQLFNDMIHLGLIWYGEKWNDAFGEAVLQLVFRQVAILVFVQLGEDFL